MKSATLNLPSTRERVLTIDATHSDVCKFAGDDDKFEPVKRAIGNLACEAIANKKKQARIYASIENTITACMPLPHSPVCKRPLLLSLPLFSAQQTSHEIGRLSMPAEVSPSASSAGSKQTGMTHFEVPFDTNPNYVERFGITDCLTNLFGDFESSQRLVARRVVLYGLGGAGKTEIAARYAEKHRRCYSAVFWI